MSMNLAACWKVLTTKAVSQREPTVSSRPYEEKEPSERRNRSWRW